MMVRGVQVSVENSSNSGVGSVDDSDDNNVVIIDLCHCNYISRESQKCILVTCVCVSVCRCMFTLLHGPGCNFGEIVGGAPQLRTIGWICSRCTGFVALATQRECEMSASAYIRYMPGFCLQSVLEYCRETAISTGVYSRTDRCLQLSLMRHASDIFWDLAHWG